MIEKPPADRPLDAKLALSAVREQLPSLACKRATFLGDGWGHDVYLLDDRYTARFPRTAREARETDFDESVFRLVGSCLASAFAVQTVVARGKPGAHFPYDFLVCTLVPGLTSGHPDALRSEELAGDLGRALTRIHSVNVSQARAAGVREVEWDAGYAGPLHFIHADFQDGNLIVHPTTGRLVGVIDWGNCALGDRTIDFMTLVAWRGWDFMHRVLRAYELPIDVGFMQRVEDRVRAQSEQSGLLPPTR